MSVLKKSLALSGLYEAVWVRISKKYPTRDIKHPKPLGKNLQIPIFYREISKQWKSDGFATAVVNPLWVNVL